MSDFSYSSWAAYRQDTGALASDTGNFNDFAFWYGEGSSNTDGTLGDDDDDDQYEGVVGSGGSDQANHDTGGASGFSGNIAPLSFYGTLDIGGTIYPVFLDSASADYVLFAQSDNELPASITIGAIQLASNGATFPFCFMHDTRIATPDGEIAIQDLSIGDLVLTADGAAVPVKWLGRQTVFNPLRAVMDPKLAPVCIAARALGNHSDLLVSADHGMIVDGLVINAAALVNGQNVRFAAATELPERFVYYHIETGAHDVILANGAASETFIDTAGRAAFDNHQEYLSLYGAERIIPEMPALRISSQRLVPQAIKDRLGMRGRSAFAKVG